MKANVGSMPDYSGKSRMSSFGKAVIRHKYIYMLVLPGIIFYILFNYLPMYGLILAFKKFMYNAGIWGSPWVGLDNFRFIMMDSGFWNSFKNTLIISFGKLLIVSPAPIILALLLNELRSQRFKRTIQSVLYLPHFFSWVIISGIIFSLFSTTSGTVSKILVSNFGMTAPKILGNPDVFRWLVFGSSIWRSAGWGTIIYLAAIAGINPELYEAAIMDGAGRLKQVLHITLPSLKYAIIILYILDIGSIMDAGFDQIFNLYDPGTYQVADIIDTYVYRMGIVGARFETSTAIGLFRSVINCTLLLCADRLAKALGEQGLY